MALADLVQMIEEIRPVPSEQGYELDLTGDLADLLAFAASGLNDERPASDPAGRSMNLVAGVRNPRRRTLPEVALPTLAA